MTKTKLLLLGMVTLLTGMNTLAEEIQSLKEKALLYLPMEKDKILAQPATGATLKLLGDKPVFNDGKKGQSLVIDDQGISIKGIKLTGANLINGKQGTIAYWMKPLVSYTTEKGRQYFLTAREYLGGGNLGNGQYVYIDSPSGGFYFQTVRDRKWLTNHFNFNWWRKPQWSNETWYHIAVTWGPDVKTTFYVNGNPIHKGKKKGSSSAEMNVKNIYIGCSGAEKKSANALLDEFYIFGEILSTENIKSLMADTGK